MEAKLREYARLMVVCGVNLKPGQRLQITAQVDTAPLVRLVTEEAFQAGAADVEVTWTDDAIRRMRYLHADETVFDEPDSRSEAYWQGVTCRGDADLRITSSAPTVFQGVDQGRVSRELRALLPVRQLRKDRMSTGKLQWCIAACASRSWACEVFPDLPPQEALEKLWDAIFAACLVTGDGTAPEKWEKKQEDFQRRVEILNRYAFRQLRYRSGLGTDLTVGLPEHHFWEGGFSFCEGRPYLPNIPTEEIFTSPHRLEVEGTVVSSLPLFLAGVKVEGIRMRLEKGKIVEVSATAGEQTLLDQMDLDEGGRYLGECALVSWDSPIRNTGILFRNTLFDENASCHFAFGDAYNMVEGSESMKPEERLAAGLNVSATHVDFMVGTEDLQITGITADGREIPLVENGNLVL